MGGDNKLQTQLAWSYRDIIIVHISLGMDIFSFNAHTLAQSPTYSDAHAHTYTQYICMPHSEEYVIAAPLGSVWPLQDQAVQNL